MRSLASKCPFYQGNPHLQDKTQFERIISHFGDGKEFLIKKITTQKLVGISKCHFQVGSLTANSIKGMGVRNQGE